MPEEKEEVKEEVKPSFLDEVKREREALEKIRDENKQILEELKQLKAEDIMSGRVSNAPAPEPPQESPQDYLNRILKNK